MKSSRREFIEATVAAGSVPPANSRYPENGHRLAGYADLHGNNRVIHFTT